MGTLGVQNSSFERARAFFTLLVEEKGKEIVFGSQILVFGQKRIFLSLSRKTLRAFLTKDTLKLHFARQVEGKGDREEATAACTLPSPWLQGGNGNRGGSKLVSRII